MAFSGGDKVWIVYQGPPRWDGSQWVNGDRFFLSGHKAHQGKEGVEFAPGVSGLERPASEYRYDRAATVPGARFMGSIADRRTISASVNILGDTPKEVRDNKRKWMRNNPEGEPGKLWVLTSDGYPRYLYAVRTSEAGITTLEKDPSIRNLYEAMEWGWESNSPYFRGYREAKELKRITPTSSTYRRTFYNPSTAIEVFPSLYLPGSTSGSRWEVSRGFEQGTFVTPPIYQQEEARIDFSPENPTFVKRNLSTGETTNLWYSLDGARPRFSLEPETKNTYEVKLNSGVPSNFTTKPRLTFVPLFESWI